MISAGIERGLFVGAIVVAAGLLVQESYAASAAKRSVPFSYESLNELVMAGIESGEYPQMVDTRPLVDEDNLDVGGFEELHVPKSMPIPGCDIENAPEGAAAQINKNELVIVISAEGDEASFEACASVFPNSQNLTGGVLGWIDNGGYEEYGEWIVPSADGMAGGGCL